MTRRRSPGTTQVRAVPGGVGRFARGPLLRPLVMVLVVGLPATLLPGVAVVSRADALDATAAPVQDLRFDAAGDAAGLHPAPQVSRAEPVSSRPGYRGPAAAGEGRPIERATPLRLTLPTVGVDAPVVPVGLEASGEMEVPKDVSTVGWYEPVAGAGVVPGANGTAVLAGHVSSFTRGPGAFASLERLVAGDEVLVELTDGSVQHWSVTGIEHHEKERLPVDELFTWDGPPRLVLVTCGGTFDLLSGSHRDNVVVTLAMTDERAALDRSDVR